MDWDHHHLHLCLPCNYVSNGCCEKGMRHWACLLLFLRYVNVLYCIKLFVYSICISAEAEHEFEMNCWLIVGR